MFCNQCGQENSNDAKFCSSCGNKLEIQNIQASHAPPQLEKTDSPRPIKKRVELWNPNAAANWSLLFTPIFGSYLQMKNWQALGKLEDANTAKNWIIFTIIFILFINFATPFIWDDIEKVTTISRGLGFWYIIIWYFAYARKQPKYVKENLNDKYQKKSWLTPLSSATVILFISFTVLMVVSSSIIQSLPNQQISEQKNDVDWDNGIITPPSSSLTCGENSGSSPKGLEFYGPISYKLSDNNPVKTQVTWGVKYADSNLQNDSYSGSLRIRLYAVSESYSGSSLNGYVIGEYFPNFNGDGSASTNQLKVNYNVENIVSKDEKNLKIPSGKYCTVITLEEFDEQSCSSTDRFCIQSWMQFKDPATFF
ncbi:zinc ribbon domain-containing protein [Acinetobacter sp. TR11]|uniref:zinc ribbon domain-containing protein n=1 Tax=Acinetobacter sp. TR11 TaxID=3003393 RepID=UPI0022ABE29B|nr:zinc ribbon domain-containing protein [Acinetobacter sp. TR11]WAU72373.1 zinc ribbon domain-containing protein [Acinetobacter sp. TR11]